MWLKPIFTLFVFLVPLSVQAQTMYTVTDLGSLGGNVTFVTGVNSAGTAVGGSTDSSGRLRAFIWKDGVMQSIEPAEGYTRSLAMGISNSGKVVGRFDNQESCDYPNCRSVAFVYDKSVQLLPTLGGTQARGNAISNSGYVVGASTTPSNSLLRGFIFRKDAIRGFGTLGGLFSQAYAVNSKGIAAGAAGIPGPGTQHAVIFRGDIIEDLGTLGGDSSLALGINNAGEVVGYSGTTNNEKVRGFLARDGQMYDLGTFGGRDSLAFAINNSSQIVGTASTPTRGSQAFLHENGEMIDLNDRITDNRWGLIDAKTISDSGIIGINGTFQGVHSKAVLLTPVVN
jgi:probable HAF family extracellular repeat protein